MTAVSLALLADLLVDELKKHCADPSPVRDPSETSVVDMLYRKGEPFADIYVARRIIHVLGRLRATSQPGGEAWKTGDVVHDGLLVLGGYAHLCELKLQVAA